MNSILIVEDDSEVRATLQEILATEGYFVHIAENGQEGLDLLRTIEKPCLILLDLMMPIMDGFQFLKLIRQDQAMSDIPVIVLAGMSQDQAPPEANFFISKPFSSQALLNVVRDCCGPGVSRKKSIRTSSRIR